MANTGDYVVVCLLGIISVLSFTGSVLIIVAAIINKKLRSFTHILIINQAAADMLLSATSIPLRALRLATRSKIFESECISSRVYCIHTTFISIFLFGASVFGLFLLTLDRFLGIRFSIPYRIKIRSSYIIASITLAWLSAFVIGFLPLLITQLQSKLDLHATDTACIYGTVISLNYMIFVNISTLYLPLFVMLLMYLLIIHKVHKSWSIFRGNPSKQANRMRRASVVDPSLFRNKEIRLARGIFCVLFTHVICLTPIAIVDWMHTFGGVHSPSAVIKICLVLTYANAVADPIIYAAFSQEYKNAFWRLIFCKYCRSAQRGRTPTLSDVNKHIVKICTDGIPLDDITTRRIASAENVNVTALTTSVENVGESTN